MLCLKLMMNFFTNVKAIKANQALIDASLIKTCLQINVEDLEISNDQASTQTLDFRIEPFANADQLVTIANNHYLQLLTSLAKLLTSQWQNEHLDHFLKLIKGAVLKDIRNDPSLLKQPHRFYEQIYQPVFLRFYEQLINQCANRSDLKALVSHYQWPNHCYENLVNFYEHYLKNLKDLRFDQLRFLKSFDDEIYYQVLNDHFAINYDGDYEQGLTKNQFWSFYQKLSDLKTPVVNKKRQMGL